MRYVSEDPFTLSCDSTHLPPYQLTFSEQILNPYAERPTYSISSHLIDRGNSTYDNVLAGNPQPSIPNYICLVFVEVQPYYGDEETYKDRVYHECELLKLNIAGRKDDPNFNVYSSCLTFQKKL